MKGLSVDEATRIVDDFLADFNGNIPLKPFIRRRSVKSAETSPTIPVPPEPPRVPIPSADLFTVVAEKCQRDRFWISRSSFAEGTTHENPSGVEAKADLLKTLRHEFAGSLRPGHVCARR